MRKNTDEKNLIVYDENSIFSGILRFFRKLLYGKNHEIITTETSTIQNTVNVKTDFLQSLKVIDEELEKLKQDIESRKIAITDLTEKQIDKLQKVYDKQIENDKIRLSDLQRKLKHLTSNI